MAAYVLIGCLTAVATLILFLGFGYAHRSNKPQLFRIGSITAASGLILLWIGLWWVFSEDRGSWAMPMFVATLLIPVSLLGIGLQLMARACAAAEETHRQSAFEDFLRQNDLP